MLAGRGNGWIDRLARVFEAYPRAGVDYGLHGDTVDRLVDAVARGRVCRVVYKALSTGATTEQSIEPICLKLHGGALYVLAHDRGRKARQMFAVHRIESVEVTDEACRPRRAGTVAASAFGISEGPDEPTEVEVPFFGQAALQVAERITHPGERKAWLGGGELRYQTRTGSRLEVLSWVLSFGPGAELVAPVSSRRELAARLRETATRYGAVMVEGGDDDA